MIFFCQIVSFLKANFQYSRYVWQGYHCCIQGDNNNNTGSKFQRYTEGLEEHGINVTGRKQAQITSGTVEVIEIRETHT